MNDIEFFNAAKIFPLGTPFLLGGKSKKGVDCLFRLKAIAEKLNLEFPDEYKGWTWQNYAKKWEDDCYEGMKIFKEFLLSLGETIDPSRMIAGDIIVLEGGGVVSAVLYDGKNHFQAVHNVHGVMAMPYWPFRSKVISVRRLEKRR